MRGWQKFKSIARKIVTRRVFGLAMGVAVGLTANVMTTAPAEAHGEKSQMAFLRMRTVQWYDLKWSKTDVNVNDVVEISGKFNVFSNWPQAVMNPDVSFLNVGEPGPVFVREAAYINGQPVPRSFSLTPGERYDFKILLRARRAGDWHVHTLMNVEGGGPIIGPGEWLKIKGSMADFINPETTLDGRKVDIETMGIGTIYGWHFLWFVAGVAWIGYWFSRGGFVGRYFGVVAGKGDTMISPKDEKIAFASLAATLVVVLVGYSMGESGSPRTLPLQAGLLNIPASDPALYPKDVSIKYERATYKVPGRELDVTLQITNNGTSPLRIGEFATAGVRFLNPDVMKEPVNYPDYLLAPQGLSLSDAQPIQPGTTKTLVIKAQDAAWDVERLSDLYYDTDSSIGGLLFLFDEQGNRHVLEIGGPAVPDFQTT